ncbi:PTS glucitol/sorbitol transporter subunit IIA [Orbus sturtevantii]|uniref:PTS glucitol/sorbitol transporter subunit IIA n=1 Tax=Orbus sturtevantii TaxID=3074109 RepID=UPI00370DDD18
MNNIIYRSIILGIGDFVADVLADGILITFKQGAPSELADYCCIHSHGELTTNLAIGQTIKFGDFSYLITAIGEVATTNFRELGHITVRFDGKRQAELAGSIHVIGQAPTGLKIGDSIIIVAN